MKIVKYILVVLTLTSVLAIGGVQATSYISFVGIDLPSMSRTYTSSEETKTKVSYQYAKKIGAIDNVTGAERAVDVRTISDVSYSLWIRIPKGSIETWGQDLNMYENDYQLQLKLATWSFSGASFSGTWYLDDLLV